MEEVLQFLKENPVFFIATNDNGQPRVRPFGAVIAFEGKLYICTNNQKKVFAQIKSNPQVEICGFNGAKAEWLRIEATAAEADRRELRAQMLEENPVLKDVYTPDDGLFVVIGLSNCTATFCSMASLDPIKTVSF